MNALLRALVSATLVILASCGGADGSSEDSSAPSHGKAKIQAAQRNAQKTTRWDYQIPPSIVVSLFRAKVEGCHGDTADFSGPDSAATLPPAIDFFGASCELGAKQSEDFRTGTMEEVLGYPVYIVGGATTYTMASVSWEYGGHDFSPGPYGSVSCPSGFEPK